MNTKIILSIVILFTLIVSFAPTPLEAAAAVRDLTGIDNAATNPGLGTQELETTVQDIIKIILSFLGLIAVIVILIGGFMWMTAGGNSEQVAKGRSWIINGVIGLVIILSAYAIASFVIDQAADVTT